MMENKVESITENDADDLVELIEASGPFVSARSSSDYWLYARLFSTTCLCVRNDNGQPIAALLAFKDQTPGKSEIYIQDLVVHPGHRRQGYGEALMGGLHQRAESDGVERLWLTSEADNEAAAGLWARLGYRNDPSDYQQNGVWITRDLKGRGRDRAVFASVVS